MPILVVFMVSICIVLSSSLFIYLLLFFFSIFSGLLLVFTGSCDILYYELEIYLKVFMRKYLYQGRLHMSYIETMDLVFFISSMTLYSMGCMVKLCAMNLLVWVIPVVFLVWVGEVLFIVWEGGVTFLTAMMDLEGRVIVDTWLLLLRL